MFGWRVGWRRSHWRTAQGRCKYTAAPACDRGKRRVGGVGLQTGRGDRGGAVDQGRAGNGVLLSPCCLTKKAQPEFGSAQVRAVIPRQLHVLSPMVSFKAQTQEGKNRNVQVFDKF